MRMIVALVTAVSVSGCSLLFVDGPSSGLPPTVYPSCDESLTFPVIDLVLTALYTVAAVDVATRDHTDNDPTSAAIGSSLLAATFAASAWVGFSRTSACQHRRAELAASYGRPGAGQPGYPAPTGTYPAYPAPEGQTCHPQLGCQPGLTCASNLCVRLAPPIPAPPPPAPAPPPPAAGSPR